ncbi:MbnH family di-heme enzyme [Shewanella sp. HL-SH8]|uniref:MbnH family di-heme enzyme n=1 Tax=Shewanella sp. HL-SH8 TaxID=3436242 RepID=UPI003EBFD25D
MQINRPSKPQWLATMALALLMLLALGCGQESHQQNDNQAESASKVSQYEWPIPEGFPKPEVPADNPMTQAKVTLGRYLFYDTRLSANQTQSCASCHVQSKAFTETLKVSIGSTGQAHTRNAPALVNIAYNKTLTWAHDGLTHIEDQVLLPLFSEQPVEMGLAGKEALILARFTQAPYPALFEQAFGQQANGVDFIQITQALASFVRSLVSLNSPFDAYAYNEQDDALNEAQLAGMALFFSEKLECHHCHGGFNFTQSTSHEKQPLDRRPFHNTGLYYTERTGLVGTSLASNSLADTALTPVQQNSQLGYPQKDTGLAQVSGKAIDDGRFRAPSLRNISLTAPYMHDGSVVSLSEVIDIYAAGGRNITAGEHQGDGRQNPLKSPFIKGFEISEAEKRQLLAFLASLTDEQFITNTDLSDPWVKIKP